MAKKPAYEVTRTRKSKPAAKNCKCFEYQFAGPFQKDGEFIGVGDWPVIQNANRNPNRQRTARTRTRLSNQEMTHNNDIKTQEINRKSQTNCPRFRAKLGCKASNIHKQRNTEDRPCENT